MPEPDIDVSDAANDILADVAEYRLGEPMSVPPKSHMMTRVKTRPVFTDVDVGSLPSPFQAPGRPSEFQY